MLPRQFENPMKHLASQFPGEGVLLTGEPKTVQGLEKPLPTPVPGKHTAGTITALGGRGQADEQDPASGISEAGQGAGPIGPVLKPPRYLLGYLLTICDQPGTLPAGDDFFLKVSKLSRSVCHII